MIFGSICSGMGAAELAWHRLGWRCASTAVPVMAWIGRRIAMVEAQG